MYSERAFALGPNNPLKSTNYRNKKVRGSEFAESEPDCKILLLKQISIKYYGC